MASCLDCRQRFAYPSCEGFLSHAQYLVGYGAYSREGAGMSYAERRLALVDNDPLALSLLVQRLPQWVPGIEIYWYTDSDDQAVRKCLNPDSSPDVLLLDLSLREGESGVKICRSLRADDDSVWILGMTSYSLHHYANDLAEAGAQGIVSKGDPKMLALAINTVCHQRVFNPLEETTLFQPPSSAHKRIAEQRKESKRMRLSPQEERIFELLSQGYDYATIASEFGVRQSSIRTQAHRAVRKLEANTLAHALVLWVTRDEDWR